jgi:hypothetical protein
MEKSMALLLIKVPRVDGSLSDFEEDEQIIERLAELRRIGYTGKALVHELLTDDWGCPPACIRIVGVKDDGTVIDETLSYD